MPVVAGVHLSDLATERPVLYLSWRLPMLTLDLPSVFQVLGIAGLTMTLIGLPLLFWLGERRIRQLRRSRKAAQEHEGSAQAQAPVGGELASRSPFAGEALEHPH
jgi:hypothetical protein